MGLHKQKKKGGETHETILWGVAKEAITGGQPEKDDWGSRVEQR